MGLGGGGGVGMGEGWALKGRMSSGGRAMGPGWPGLLAGGQGESREKSSFLTRARQREGGAQQKSSRIIPTKSVVPQLLGSRR